MHFGFVCSLFVLFWFPDKNTPRPCITDAIGGSHRFPLPVSPQYPMAELPFQPPTLNRLSARTSLYPLIPPDQSSLSSLLLRAIFEPKRQVLWSIPFFLIVLPAPPIHFRTNTPSAVSQSCHFSTDYLTLQAIFEPTIQSLWASPVFFVRLPAPPIHFWTDMPITVIQSCNYSSDYLPLQDIFKLTRQALWASPVIPHWIHHSSMTPLA